MVGPQDVWECVCVCVCVFLLSTCLNGVSTQTDTTHSSSICEGKEDFYCPWGYRRGHWGSAGGGRVTRRAYLKGQSVPGCSSSLTRWLNSDPPVSRRWPVPSVTLSFHGGLKFTRRQISNKINEGSLHLSIYLSIYDVLNSYNTGTLSDILKHFKVHVRPFFTRFWSQLDGAVWTWSCFFFHGESSAEVWKTCWSWTAGPNPENKKKKEQSGKKYDSCRVRATSESQVLHKLEVGETSAVSQTRRCHLPSKFELESDDYFIVWSLSWLID